MGSLMDIANEKLGAPPTNLNAPSDDNNMLMSIAQSKLGAPINSASSASSGMSPQPMSANDKLQQIVRMSSSPMGLGAMSFLPGAKNARDFLFGGDSGYGTAGNIARTLPVGELGATATGAGAVAKGLGLGGNTLTKMGEMISPLYARSKLGAFGKTALSGGLGSGALTAGENVSEGKPIGQDIASNTALGAAAAPLVGAAASYTSRAGIKALEKAKPFLNYVRNLAGGSNVNEIDQNALNALNKAGQTNSRISSEQYYQPLWQETNARGMSAGSKPNLTLASDQLGSDAKKLGPQYSSLKEEIKNAPDLDINSPEALDKKKSYYQQQATKAISEQDATAAHYYNKLADAADEDLSHAFQNTDLMPQLQKARDFHSKYVIPLRQFQEAGMAGNTDKIHEVLRQPEGKKVIQALTPDPQYPEHMVANAALSQELGTTPKNLLKAATLTKGSVIPETSRLDTQASLKRYAGLSKIAPHLKNKMGGTSSLFDISDMSKLNNFAKQYGISTEKIKPEDLAYLATEMATHLTGGLPYKAARTASSGSRLGRMFGAEKALANPQVFEAGLHGNTLGMLRQLQKLRNLKMMQSVSPAVAGVTGLFNGGQ